jgi:hypothetical protein
VHEAHCPQGYTVQGRQGKLVCARKASLRQKAARLWRTDKTGFPQESQDNKEGVSSFRVQGLQVQDSAPFEEMQEV